MPGETTCSPDIAQAQTASQPSQLLASVPHGAMAMVGGRLIGFTPGERRALVMFMAGERQRVHPARSVVDLNEPHLGVEVLLGFEAGDAARPVVLGLLGPAPMADPGDDEAGTVTADLDGRRLIVEARHELVLRCGKASIVLRADGRVEIQGDTIVSTALRANRIRGGSVELN